MLSYVVNAQVGGKIAQLGARLIDATAKQMADMFFDRFSAALSPPIAADAGGAPEVLATPAAPPKVSLLALMPKEPYGLPLVAWIGIVIYIPIFVLIFGSLLF